MEKNCVFEIIENSFLREKEKKKSLDILPALLMRERARSRRENK